MQERKEIEKIPIEEAMELLRKGGIDLAPKEPEASSIRWAFNEIAKGVFASDQIRPQMNKLYKTKLSRSAFHIAIRNPLYCGMSRMWSQSYRKCFQRKN